jgi:uncharacterized SAM-binding protein YcdF (DUF218 family)
MRKITVVLVMAMVACLTSCIFFTPSRDTLFARAKEKAPYDAIIIPGLPYDSAEGKWSDLMKIRVYWSLYLYQKGIAKNIIYSGSAVYTPFVESKVMAMYGEALGIPKEHILVDTAAEHSTENLYYSYYLAKRNGFTSIAVATDPVQSQMLRNFPKKVKIKMDFIPMVMDKLHENELKDVAVDPSSAKAKNFTSIIQREGFWKRLKGTMGKNIKPVPEDIRYVSGTKNPQPKSN